LERYISLQRFIPKDAMQELKFMIRHKPYLSELSLLGYEK